MIKDERSYQAVTPDTQTKQPSTISEADYEQMYHLLYAYGCGAISFLDLLDQYEHILHIKPSQANRSNAID